LLIKYLDYDERVSATTGRHVLYVDIDNVIENKLSTFFDDYYEMVTSEYGKRNISNFSLFSAFCDTGRTDAWDNLGTMYDRQHSDGCLTAWRAAEINSFWHVSDQSILLRVVNNFT
jgi:hypothetical protein